MLAPQDKRKGEYEPQQSAVLKKRRNGLVVEANAVMLQELRH
jgi:hypothetical protein